MSFDNVQLPSFVMADLYKQSLVVLDDIQVKAKKPLIKNSTAGPTRQEITDNSTAIKETERAFSQMPEPGMVTPVIRYMGGFTQQVSIVIAEPDHEHIFPEDLKFLEKIMAACKLSLEDMAIINVVTNEPAAKQLWQLMPAKVVLMFDVATSAIGIPFYQPHFKVQHWDNAQFLNAPPLSAFRGTDTPELKALKRQLWEGLQKIFLGK